MIFAGWLSLLFETFLNFFLCLNFYFFADALHVADKACSCISLLTRGYVYPELLEITQFIVSSLASRSYSNRNILYRFLYVLLSPSFSIWSSHFIWKRKYCPYIYLNFPYAAILHFQMLSHNRPKEFYVYQIYVRKIIINLWRVRFNCRVHKWSN